MIRLDNIFTVCVCNCVITLLNCDTIEYGLRYRVVVHFPRAITLTPEKSNYYICSNSFLSKVSATFLSMRINEILYSNAF